jgi:hypothetical protein
MLSSFLRCTAQCTARSLLRTYIYNTGIVQVKYENLKAKHIISSQCFKQDTMEYISTKERISIKLSNREVLFSITMMCKV